MCDDTPHDSSSPISDPRLDPVLNPSIVAQPSRRLVLGAMAGLAASPLLITHRAAAATSATSLSGQEPIIAAMHVHASWSEGDGSWEAQYAQAAAAGVDLLYLTDHDFRALAYTYMTSLSGVVLVTSTLGGLVQSVATNTAGVVRLLAESSGTTPASVIGTVQDKPAANNRMRTSIAGHRLTIGFGSVRLDAGATYELRVQLSVHPAFGTRPAGQFELRYQFGATTTSRYVDGSGLIGYVAAPTPASGSSVTVDLTNDAAALWPDMLAFDNAIHNLSLVVTSPAQGVVADVNVTVKFTRSANDEATLISLQRTVVNTYGTRYPSMTAWPSVEISRMGPHVIPYGVPQFWPDQKQLTSATASTWYPQTVASVHAQGGVVSWAHPFGATAGPLLQQSQQDAKRRSVFSSMMANGRYGTDLLEVGYQIRGQVNALTHLALWDTFSRNGVFITGTGVNDNHDGQLWASQRNGFVTGIWAASTAQPDVVAALLAGKAYTFHAGLWPGAVLDMVADNAYPTGCVVVDGRTSHTLTVQASTLPTGSKLEVVGSPVDYNGTDPSTSVVKTFSATALGSAGIASFAVDTSANCFFRPQVRNSSGQVIGIGNPIWFLTTPPPNGIPPARTVIPV